MPSSRPPPIQHDPTLVRPEIAGPDSGPLAPYPIYLTGWVSRGFGRGSKDLGCPTANLPDDVIEPYLEQVDTGVYFGFARVVEPGRSNDNDDDDATRRSRSAFPGRSSGDGPEDKGEHEHDQVFPMVMSIGWNPFYNNDSRTAEVHILHEYPSDFYGKELRVVMLGFVRPEYNYSSMDALIKDIDTDKRVALASVADDATRPNYATYKDDPFFYKASELREPTIEERVELARKRVDPRDEAKEGARDA
ncbi:hypothetical protein JCM10212_006466 [Sporobolomyces blumeae]